MPNGKKRNIRGRPIIRAGKNVSKMNQRAQKSGRPVPPDQLGFFSGKAMSGMNRAKSGRGATDFRILDQ